MIVSLALLAICCSSYYLIGCVNYDDGILGRIALSGLSLSAGVGFLQSSFYSHTFDPVSQSVFVALAIFELRHIYRVFQMRSMSRITPPSPFQRMVNK